MRVKFFKVTFFCLKEADISFREAVGVISLSDRVVCVRVIERCFVLTLESPLAVVLSAYFCFALGLTPLFLNNWTINRLIGKTTKLDWIPIRISCQVNSKNPRSIRTLFWSCTGVRYQSTLASIEHIRRDKQQDTRCMHVKRLRTGRKAIENHKCPSEKSRDVLVLNRWTKSRSSSFPATGKSRSTCPSPSSQASQLLHRKKNFSSVSISRMTSWETNHDGLLPVLSCHIRIYVRLPRQSDVVIRNESTLPGCRHVLDVLFNICIALWPSSPAIRIETLALVPAFFPRAVWTVTS